MRWFYLLLPVHLLNCCAFSTETSPTLRETLAQYGCTDKDSDHSYIEPYEKLLSPFVDKPCNLLEIGVNFGGSAIMWYEHLPQAKLFLLDNRDVLMSHITSRMDLSRWQLYLEDAYTPEMILKMRQECPTGFDLIIDDGPHSIESQIFVVNSYLSLLNHGGVLIIEDIQNIEIAETLKQYVPKNSEFKIEIIDLRNVKGRWDDILFVVRRMNPQD